ncbi:semaphorin-3ab [Cyprinodon tularosa]|uniref:semaphorin-3ab n=1 Tax=Cyprinodon tularosa TaxID=77115 RepID=UPI0018E28FDD|nr:semaphorin-3ab [Cyprinodon tularosa]XP_038126609.1 semaphorin-3ab [Cyprinodon tularosa]
MGILRGTVILLCWFAVFKTEANSPPQAKNNVPRLKLSYKEMLETNNLVTFEGLANSSAYHTLVLDEEKGRLLVGAKDHIFSFNLLNISRDKAQIPWTASPTRRDECKWAGKNLLRECAHFIKLLQPFNQSHFYVCGTGAFHPVCSYLEVGKKPEDGVFRLAPFVENGRGKSPYDPKLLTASMLIDGELYAGTSADFMGRDFAIFRTLGKHHPIRTEQHDSRWLNDPRFVGVHLIPENDNPEDDKIYLFFRENAMDGEYAGKATYARIGQLCKNDLGGHRSLVNKWTTFLKARLICSVPGSNGIDTHFDELQDVFLMSTKDPKSPAIYGVFTTSSNIFKGSAVCMYSMADIRRAFLGPYAHRDGPSYQWVPFQGRVPYPRPGTCPSKTFGGFDTTKEFPDDVVTFARSHPAMFNPIYPINNKPIIVKTDVDYQFTQMVVDKVEAEDGIYDVMFIGTDMGTVLKVVAIPRSSWHDLEEVLLEEMTVFREPVAITAMELSTKQQQLYLGSDIGVSQMPLHRCEIYGKACAECCLARDPYCAWDGTECSRYFPMAKRRTRRQDIRNGDPLTQCSDLQQQDELSGQAITLDKTVYGVENSSTFLECVPKSQRAITYWQYQHSTDDRKQEIQSEERFIRTDQGLLIRTLDKKDSGIYLCHAVEHGFMQTILKVHLEVIDAERLGDLLHRDEDTATSVPAQEFSLSRESPNQKLWYRDFLSLVNHPTLNSVDEFCDQVWKRERKYKRQKAHHVQKVQAHNQQQQKAAASPHSNMRTQGMTSKWKHLQERQKGRNRRTHELERAPRSV